MTKASRITEKEEADGTYQPCEVNETFNRKFIRMRIQTLIHGASVQLYSLTQSLSSSHVNVH